MSGRMDHAFVALWLVLMVVGLVAVASASADFAANRFGDPDHYVTRHIVYAVLAASAFACVICVPLAWWRELTIPSYVALLAVLAIVLVPGVGLSANGSTRWILVGGFTVQPSEIARFLLVIVAAGYLASPAVDVSGSLSALLRPLLLLVPPAALLLLEPDLGTTVVMFAVAGALLFLAGARLHHLALLAALAAGALATLVLMRAEAMARFGVLLDPWSQQFSDGYQLTQALIAFGRGEWTGVGLGESVQKLFYLPEAHTDFIFAVIAEETGALGAMALCGAFLWLIVRGLRHGRQAEESGATHAAFIAYGAILMLGIQALVSLGVNTGLLPTKGITLPFVSYGGNSLIISSALVGLVVRAHWEATPPEMAPGRARVRA